MLDFPAPDKISKHVSRRQLSGNFQAAVSLQSDGFCQSIIMLRLSKAEQMKTATSPRVLVREPERTAL